MEQIVYLKWNSIEQPAKRIFLILLCCLQHPSDVWIKSCVMIGYHVGGRWTHLACTGLPTLIPGKGGEKVYNFWTLSLMESQKVAEDSLIKENLQDSHRFNVLQHNWLSIPVLKIHESFLILNKVRWFCYIINPTKLVQLRWLDISLVLYLGFYWPRLQLGP